MVNDSSNYLGNHVPGTTMGIVRAMRCVCLKYNQLETPYILFQGGADKFVDPLACIDLERESPSKDKTTVIYRHMWHDIPYEPEYEEICEGAAKWPKKRIKVAALNEAEIQGDKKEKAREKSGIFEDSKDS